MMYDKPFMTEEQACDVALRFGHTSIRNFQLFFGLVPDGIAGPVTQTLLLMPRCAVPDLVAVSEAQWPHECWDVTAAYRFARRLNLSDEEVQRGWLTALRFWNDVCGIRLQLIQNLEAAKVWATSGALPGPTIGWSYVPTGKCAERLEQRYDTSFRWTVDTFTLAVIHEMGHAIGLGHSGDVADVMYPSIGNRPLASYPGPGDVAEAQSRYGPPARPDPDPDPIPDPDDRRRCRRLLRAIVQTVQDFTR